MANNAPLVWIDLEMSGLDPSRERILEVAVLLTDKNLNLIAEGPELILHQSDAVLDAMDAWNTKHHGESGLTEAVRNSGCSESDAEMQVLDFLKKHCNAGQSPLAGNSIHQDRQFLARYMPQLEAFMHYRNIDVSSIKELVKRWLPQVYTNAPQKQNHHRAMQDIHESIEELRYYRNYAFISAS